MRTVSGVKAAYSQLSQAIQKAQVSNGPLNTWTTTSIEEFYNILKPNMQILKECKFGTGCFPNVIYRNLNGHNYENIEENNEIFKFILNNGTSVGILYFANGTGANIWFDINGKKGPNQWGRDLFLLTVWTNTGKIAIAQATSNDCYLDYRGWYCAKWILEHGNTDYPKNKPE